jgi:hypothetical protein
MSDHTTASLDKIHEKGMNKELLPLLVSFKATATATVTVNTSEF